MNFFASVTGVDKRELSSSRRIRKHSFLPTMSQEDQIFLQFRNYFDMQVFKSGVRNITFPGNFTVARAVVITVSFHFRKGAQNAE